MYPAMRPGTAQRMLCLIRKALHVMPLAKVYRDLGLSDGDAQIKADEAQQAWDELSPRINRFRHNGPDSQDAIKALQEWLHVYMPDKQSWELFVQAEEKIIQETLPDEFMYALEQRRAQRSQQRVQKMSSATHSRFIRPTTR